MLAPCDPTRTTLLLCFQQPGEQHEHLSAKVYATGIKVEKSREENNIRGAAHQKLRVSGSHVHVLTGMQQGTEKHCVQKLDFFF